MKTKKHVPSLILLFLSLFLLHCSYDQAKNDKILFEEQNSQPIPVIVNNFVIFKKWTLNIDELKLVDSIVSKSKQNIWDVGTEPSIWRQKTWRETPSFPVINTKDTVGYLKITDYESIIFFSKNGCGPKFWDDKIQTSYRDYIKSILLNDSLYIAIYSPIATGSSLMCINKNTGKNIWNGEVKYLEIAHSKYKNEVFIHKMGNYIILAGEESGGNLLQVIDSKTGKNLFYVHD